jgi:hypothetical protein
MRLLALAAVATTAYAQSNPYQVNSLPGAPALNCQCRNPVMGGAIG